MADCKVCEETGEIITEECPLEQEVQSDPRACEAYNALRNHLNPIIRGAVTDAVLCAVAKHGTGYLIEQNEAMNAQLFIATAQGRYLDDKLASYEIIRPGEVGLSDDIFRELGISIKSSKQIRSLINNITETVYGFEFSRATSDSSTIEPYNLTDLSTLVVAFDGGLPLEIVFNESQFENISQATAVEVADAISRSLFRQGSQGSAIAKDNGSGAFVKIISPTTGPSSTIQVLGGRAQNKLRFPQARPTTGGPSTQWTIKRVAGGSMRATWTGGANPNIGKVREEDYVNLFAPSLDPDNQGTFNVTEVQGGLVGEAFFEYDNAAGVEEIILQGTDDGFLFFFPKKETLVTKTSFTGAFQVSAGLLQVYLPAVTRVVRRGRIGAAHLQDAGAEIPCYFGPHVFDPNQPYSVGGICTTLDQEVNSNSNFIISVDNSEEFPDEAHKVIFGYGTSRQEGPVPVIQRPSDKTLFLDPSYKFKFVHPIGEDITIVAGETPYIPDKSGRDFQFYLTDVVSGRVYAQELIEFVRATGINLVFIILYPDDEGLGKWGTEFSEKVDVWGK